MTAWAYHIHETSSLDGGLDLLVCIFHLHAKGPKPLVTIPM